MKTRFFIALALFFAVLLPHIALAQCTGASGIPFNCPAGTPQTGDIVLGGSTTGSNTVKFTVSQLISVLLGLNSTWSAGQGVTPVVLTPGATVTPNAALSNNFMLTAAQNFTLANPTNLKAGQTINIWITQDATGSRVMTTGTQYQAAGSATTLVLSTAGSTKDLLTCQSDTATTLTCSVLTGIVH